MSSSSSRKHKKLEAIETKQQLPQIPEVKPQEPQEEEKKAPKKRTVKPDETDYDLLIEVARKSAPFQTLIEKTIELEDELEGLRENCLKQIFAIPDINSELKNKKQTAKLMTKLNKAVKEALETTEDEEDSA